MQVWGNFCTEMFPWCACRTTIFSQRKIDEAKSVMDKIYVKQWTIVGLKLQCDLKGSPICTNKNMAILSRRLILLAMLLHEQFRHYTNINLSHRMQFLSTQQHAYQSFLVTSSFDSICVVVACWVNFVQECLHEHELQVSDYVQCMTVFSPKCSYVC